ncbi:serine/threonine-protein kinase Sch9p [[Candida] railenensis]|uniref:Serine/threonine-protein kinase SCH9 n=1 Tax=[Candida] railenensis TaxID=45579 RepID=A0A9P0VXH9_9ASCO|nr:serine/threonine-protein kinase Sch9p [[Candida] railenensis]
MADFAKSIFGFSGFHKKGGSPEVQGQGGDGQEQSYPSPHGEVHIDDSVSASSGRFLPKGLANATPTTAISNNSLAYGTTSTKQTQNRSDSDFLNTMKQQQPLQQQDQHQHQHQYEQQQQQLQNHQQQQYQQYESAPQLSSQASSQPHTNTSSHSSQSSSQPQPIIITTDETGQNYKSTTKASSQPKGKLRVKIVEARNLLINSTHSQPYVVCTFESSEFVTNASGSYNNKTIGAVSMYNNTNNNQYEPNSIGKKRPPLYQRQSSNQHMSNTSATQQNIGSSNPIWNHEATFDVVGVKSELDISVYDAATDDSFLGHLRIFPSTGGEKKTKSNEQWLDLKARVIGERVRGQIKLVWEYTLLDTKKSFGPDDFDVLRLLGKGTFGQVFQVKKKDTNRIYAMKVLSKKVIVKKKEIAHTIGERNILVRTSAAESSFIVGLKFSFQTPTDLYLVTDYMSGGELFWHLQKEGRFTEERAKFYIAELILALEHLHDNDIVYRDLKPENILLDANGHIALCDFGLSKANLNNDGTTNTFCGTTEYLAPEVLLDESGYTKMVDFWSLGVLIFEMCCGWSPFYADNTQQMYKNIAFGKVRFPKEVLSPEGRSFVKGLLNRNPKHRLGSVGDARELRAHVFFADIDWDLLKKKNIPPPFKPHLTSETDTSNFDPEFTNESTSILKKNMDLASTPLSPGIQANFKGFTYVDDSTIEDHFSKSHKYRNPGSLIYGNPNLPPDEDVIDDDRIDEDDEMDIDEQDNMEDEEFVNGRFDL